jgi:ketosteroid isomerase-like protein
VTGFTSFPDVRASWAYQDFDADSFTEPDIISWDDYEVLVSPDLAVIKGNKTREHPQYGSVNVFQTSVFKKEDGQWKLIHSHQSYGGP